MAAVPSVAIENGAVLGRPIGSADPGAAAWEKGPPGMIAMTATLTQRVILPITDFGRAGCGASIVERALLGVPGMKHVYVIRQPMWQMSSSTLPGQRWAR